MIPRAEALYSLDRPNSVALLGLVHRVHLHSCALVYLTCPLAVGVPHHFRGGQAESPSWRKVSLRPYILFGFSDLDRGKGAECCLWASLLPCCPPQVFCQSKLTLEQPLTTEELGC